LACLEELLAQDDIALADADHIPVEEADVLGLVPFCDQGEEVELGADPAAAGTDGLLTRDLNGREVGKWRNALRSADRVKDGGEESGAAAATCQTFLPAEALLGCVDAAATGWLSKIGLAFAFLRAFVDDALYPTEGVVARPADLNLTTDIDADGAVADGTDAELGALDVEGRSSDASRR